MDDELDGTISEALGLLWQAIKRKFVRPVKQESSPEIQKYFDKKLLSHVVELMPAAKFLEHKPLPEGMESKLVFVRATKKARKRRTTKPRASLRSPARLRAKKGKKNETNKKTKRTKQNQRRKA